MSFTCNEDIETISSPIVPLNFGDSISKNFFRFRYWERLSNYKEI